MFTRSSASTDLGFIKGISANPSGPPSNSIRRSPGSDISSPCFRAAYFFPVFQSRDILFVWNFNSNLPELGEVGLPMLEKVIQCVKKMDTINLSCIEAEECGAPPMTPGFQTVVVRRCCRRHPCPISHQHLPWNGQD